MKKVADSYYVSLSHANVSAMAMTSMYMVDADFSIIWLIGVKCNVAKQ